MASAPRPCMRRSPWHAPADSQNASCAHGPRRQESCQEASPWSRGLRPFVDAARRLTHGLLLCSARLALQVAAFPITIRRVRITGTASPQRLHALRFELRSMQLWERPRLPPTLERPRPLGCNELRLDTSFTMPPARHNLCILDAASSAGPQVTQLPRISEVRSSPYIQKVHLRSLCARRTACRSAARLCGSTVTLVLEVHETAATADTGRGMFGLNNAQSTYSLRKVFSCSSGPWGAP